MSNLSILVTPSFHFSDKIVNVDLILEVIVFPFVRLPAFVLVTDTIRH